MKIKQERESTVELLKIISIFLIVVFHVTQTLTSKYIFTNINIYTGYYELFSTNDINNYILLIFRYFGAFGNLIFIICSSYYLSEVKKINKKKIAKLSLNTIIISLTFLLIYKLSNTKIDNTYLTISLFPFSSNANWFITTYLLFYLSVPYLNIIIKHLSDKELFRVSSILFSLFFIIGFINSSFNVDNIIVFITVYFIVNFIKRCEGINKVKPKIYIIILLFCIFSLTLYHFLISKINMETYFVQSNHLKLIVNNNPLILLIAISVFFFFKQFSFRSTFINVISSLTLYIYLIHENILFRSYTRVYIWHNIYERVGCNYLILQIIIYSLILFVLSVFASYVYKNTFERIIDYSLNKFIVNGKVKNTIIKIENNVVNYLFNVKCTVKK